MIPKFTTVSPGKYAVAGTIGGRAWRLLVKSQQVGNPSARGGAYMTRWQAYNGALSVTVHGDTRRAAYDAAVAALAARGLVFTPDA